MDWLLVHTSLVGLILMLWSANLYNHKHTRRVLAVLFLGLGMLWVGADYS
jgi:hypothetical protein